MPVDKGNPGAASAYYGTGESEQRLRNGRDEAQLRDAYVEGRTEAYQTGAEAPEPYNEGLASQAKELRDASFWRAKAVRETGQMQGRN